MKIPEGAEREIRAKLARDQEISSGELNEILRRHGVAENVDILQRRYRQSVGQQFMATFRDEKGQREILAASNGKGGMDYLILEFCKDDRRLHAIQRRLQHQASGLNVTADRVSGRRRLLHHYGIGEVHDEE